MAQSQVHNWLQSVQGWLLPPTCVRCGCEGRKPAFDLCEHCETEFVVQREAKTRGHRHLDSVFALYLYEYPVDRLLQQFKYEGRLEAGRVLARLLAAALCAQIQTRPEALVPVPLARAKLRERGFNQALELARPIARALGLPVRNDLCAKIRVTQDQAGLGAHERHRNVQGAFAMTSANTPHHVVLIDDVMTTGSTCDEVARVLKAAGVERVDAWVVARATRADTQR